MQPAPPRCLLALDTATDQVHLALLANTSLPQVHTRVAPGGAQASATTLPQLAQMLAQAGMAWSDVQGIAFGQGPGAFTGLRTACSVTQGLALGLGVPVWPLDTLMTVAESARLHQSDVAAWLAAHPGQPLWVLQDARMSEVYVGAYTWSVDEGWRQHTPPQLWTLPVLREQIAMGRLACAAGSALRAYPDDVAALRGPRAPDASPDGAALASLALHAWRHLPGLDAALALPLYVRDKVAQTTAERAQQRLQVEQMAQVTPAPGGAM